MRDVVDAVKWTQKSDRLSRSLFPFPCQSFFFHKTTPPALSAAMPA